MTERIQPPRNADTHALAVLHHVTTRYTNGSLMQWLICCNLGAMGIVKDLLSASGIRVHAFTLSLKAGAREKMLEDFRIGSCDVLLAVPHLLLAGGLDIRVQAPYSIACTFPMRMRESALLSNCVRDSEGDHVSPEIAFLSNRSGK